MPCIRSCSRFFSSFPPVFSSFSLHVNFLFFCEGVALIKSYHANDCFKNTIIHIWDHLLLAVFKSVNEIWQG